MAYLKKLHPDAKIEGKIEITDKKVKTNKGRLSYPSLFKQKTYKGEEIGWGATILIPKDSDISELRIAADNAAIEKWGSDIKKWPSKTFYSKKLKKKVTKCIVKSPFRDGDVEYPDKPEYENMWFINFSSRKKAPGVCDGQSPPQPIEDESGIKAGDYVRFSGIAFPYDTNGNAGVSFALQNVQKMGVGEGFGGGMAAEDEFDGVDGYGDEGLDDDDNDDSSEENDEDENDLGY